MHTSLDFYNIHRLIKEKNMDLETFHKFIKHLEGDIGMGKGLKETF